MKDEVRVKVEKYGEELLRVFPEAKVKDPAGLCRRLRRLGMRGYRGAEGGCNNVNRLGRVWNTGSRFELGGSMGFEYGDPKREYDKYALPDIEVFEVWEEGERVEDCEGNQLEPGWYWWSCFPGCLPDGEPIGPFETKEEALADA